jgi:hypothetical protein
MFNMHVQVVGNGLVDAAQEAQELLVAVAAVLGRDVECGEQTGHPGAQVVVGTALGNPALHG